MNKFTHLTHKSIGEIQPYKAGKPVEQLLAEYNCPRVVKLASNENLLGPSQKVVKVLTTKLDSLFYYPDMDALSLKAKLASHLGCSPEMLVLGNGSNDILEIITRVFASGADSRKPFSAVMFSEYAFIMYKLVTQAIGAEMQIVKTESHKTKSYQRDPAAFIKAINRHTRLILIDNPNNPTGDYISLTELKHLLEQVPDNIIIALDQAYHEYSDEADTDMLPWLDQHPNLVITRTFSKIYGLAGLRVGYGICHPDMADLLNRVRQPFNVNLLGQLAAEAALADQAHVERSRLHNHKMKKQLTDYLEQASYTCLPSGANFLTVHFGEQANQVYQTLLTKGIILRPLANYGMPEHLRITLGTEEDNNYLIRCLSER